MKFPKYWKIVKNSTGLVTARGWSNHSEAEAALRAEERLQRILKWLRSSRSDELDRYHYVIDDSICELVIDQIVDSNGQEIAVISRNAYGALVLNAATVMIVDVDVESSIVQPGFFARIFGAKAPSVETVLQQKLNAVRDWQLQNSAYAFRIYRTAAGLRLIFTNQVFSQVDSAVINMMDQLHSDPLYRDLCISQKCFRARLTPKPWRIGLLPPAQQFPFSSELQEKAFNEWCNSYTTASSQWAVCELLESIGEVSSHPTALQIVDLHDNLCCRSGSKLA